MRAAARWGRQPFWHHPFFVHAENTTTAQHTTALIADVRVHARWQCGRGGQVKAPRQVRWPTEAPTRARPTPPPITPMQCFLCSPQTGKAKQSHHIPYVPGRDMLHSEGPNAACTACSGVVASVLQRRQVHLLVTLQIRKHMYGPTCRLAPHARRCGAIMIVFASVKFSQRQTRVCRHCQFCAVMRPNESALPHRGPGVVPGTGRAPHPDTLRALGARTQHSLLLVDQHSTAWHVLAHLSR